MSKPYEPTAESRRTVETMAAFGIPQDEIAKCLKIARGTLLKHYAEELDTAATRANSAVAKSLFINATEKGNTTAQIFWLKCRAGWKEAPVDVNLTTRKKGGADGPVDLRSLTLDELLTLERILGRPSRGVVVDVAPARREPDSRRSGAAAGRPPALASADSSEDDL